MEYFSAAMNQEGAIYDSSVHNTDEKKFLKDGFFMVPLVRRSGRYSVEAFSDESILSGAGHPLHITNATWNDRTRT